MLCNSDSIKVVTNVLRKNVSGRLLTCLLVLVSLLMPCACDRGTNIGCFRKPTGTSNSNMHLNIRADSVDTCISNCEKLFYRYATLDGATCSCTHVLSVEAVAPSECNRPCAENPHQYCGGEDGTESYYDTGLRTAGPITSVKFKNVTEDTIAVAWMPPESKSLLDHYLIRAEVLETFSTRQLLDTEWVVSREERQFDLIGLHPGTRYNITIASVGESGLSPDSGSISLVQWTEVGTPDQEPEEPKVLSSDGTSQIIEIRPVINNNGPISNYRLVVIFVTHGLMQTFDESLLRTYNESQEEGTQYYVAAELELNNNSTRRIKIGDGRMYNGFYNAPLPPKSHIHVAVGVISTLNGVTKSIYGQTSHEQHSNLGEDLFALDDEGNSVMIVVLTIFCVILALLLAASVAMFVYVRRHTTSRRKRLTESHELATQNGGGPSHEMENNGFIGDELNAGDFKQQLQELFDRIPSHQLVARNTLSLDIDNILGTGRFGDVIHGNLLRANGATNHGSLGNSSQIHVISEDMEAPDQVLFLKELDQLLRIQPHPMFMTLLGICSTPDWMYIIFEDTGKTLKQRLIESRLPMNANATRLSTLSEEFVLRIMSNIADAMEYLAKHLIVHKQVCSYNVWMTANDEPKLSIFGPTLYIEDRKLVDLARYQAPEVLRYQHHTTKSDVWSFACLAWECCTLGGTLYSNVVSADLMSRIRTGSRPEQTPFIFNDLYQLLLNCWELDAGDRLEMDDVAGTIRQMLHTSPKHVLSFERHDGLTLPYYLPLLEIKNFD